MKQMKLDTFLKQERERLIKFEIYWRKNQQEEPECFPESMLPGDWDENYNIFDESE